MDENEIRGLLESGLGECQLELQSEGNKLMLVVTASIFAGLNRVKRQQLVYGFLKDKISTGEIHAVSMKCVSPTDDVG